MFLHKVFGGLSKNRQRELHHLYGFAAPEDYNQLMSWCNGATLFDNALFIYGVCSDVTRGLRLEDQRPVSLDTKIEIARLTRSPDDVWRPFGAVTGYADLYSLEISQEGRTRVVLRAMEGRGRLVP